MCNGPDQVQAGPVVCRGNHLRFPAAGFRGRDSFNHEVLYLRKQYPGTLRALERCGLPRVTLEDALATQVNLYATDLSDPPAELFLDSDRSLCRQQLGRPGLIASAGLCFTDGDRLFVSLLQSDLLRQLLRQPQPRSLGRVFDNRYHGWYTMLFNAVMALATEAGVATVFSPTAETVLRRIPKVSAPTLLEHTYDFPRKHYGSRRSSIGGYDYWQIDVAPNRGRVAALEPRQFRVKRRRTVAVLHDVEADVDTDISPDVCRQNLTAMLNIERDHGIPATYNILGTLFSDVTRTNPGLCRHALGFHSYDHDLASLTQLPSVRSVDRRITGYRPPQSRITTELSDFNLAFHDFEWLATSAARFGFTTPRVESGIAKLPIFDDDYPLHVGTLDFDSWLSTILDHAATHDFIAVSLHDCYAASWLDRYPDLLARLDSFGEFRTCDEIAEQLFLSTAFFGDPAVTPAEDHDQRSHTT